MEIIYVISGIAIGALLIFFFMNGKTGVLKSEIQSKDNQIDTLKAEIGKKENDNAEIKEKLQQEESRFLEKEKQYIKKTEELENRLQEKEKTIIRLTEEKNDAEKKAVEETTALHAKLQTLELLLNESRKKLKEQEEKFARIEENFKTEFKNMAQEILDEKSRKFTESGKKDLQEIVEPLKQRIQDFSKQVRDAYENENKERFSLKEEIKRLNEMNIRLSEEATNLAKALKGDSKTQGDWGEMILENMLSESGLTLGREYFKQQSVTDKEGNRLRPDFIVRYPDNRFIIIDSKVSLRAYESWTAAETPEDKKKYLEEHLRAVNDRVKELSSKNYQDNFEGSPDFVMMFMPVEPAFMIAVQNDPTLWNRAYEKRVIIISPTNLIAALKMISELWKHDAQNKNSIEIAEAAGNLYDKFVAFYNDLDAISKSLDKVSTNFNNAKNKLYTGRGNLVSRVEKLRTLGAKSKKNLEIAEQSLLEDAPD